MASRKRAGRDIDRHVGARIKEARRIRKISQTYLGEALTPPITFQQVQKYESGANRVSAGSLWDIARVLDVDIHYFFRTKSGEDYFRWARESNRNPEDIFFDAEEIELVRLYRGVSGMRLRDKVREFVRILAVSQETEQSE